MANLKISELPVQQNISDDFPFVVVDMLSSPIETKQVTITGMTFQGGNNYQNILDGIYNLASPYTLVGTGNDVLLTGFTFNSKRYESNGIITATIVSQKDQASVSSYFYLDVDAGTTSPNFYFGSVTAAFDNTTFIWRASNLSAGSHTLDLYVNLESSVQFDFGQIVLTYQEI